MQMQNDPLSPSKDDILAAADRIKSSCVRSPLVPYINEDVPKNTKIFLKLESLQPTGSFKHRGSASALLALSEEKAGCGVYTSSAGNFGQGLAWNAKQLGVPCTVIVPEFTPQTKLNGLVKSNAIIHKVSYDEWWNVMVTKQYEGVSGTFIHPVCNRNVIAGNGTVGLEILEDLPEVNTIVAPYGGGGLSCGIACAMKAQERDDVKVYACELKEAAPLLAAKELGHPVPVKNHQPTFVDGMGGKSVLPDMWRMAHQLLEDSLPVTLQEVVLGVQKLLSAVLVAEGAGAAPLMAALKGDAGTGNVVCVISGRNIDTNKLKLCINGDVPPP